MGLNLSNEQIAQELDLNGDDAHKMASQRREAIVARTPEVTLSGEVEGEPISSLCQTTAPSHNRQKQKMGVGWHAHVFVGIQPTS
jgi:hypothetical protein